MAHSSYVLWGSSGHAKVLASLIRSRGGQLLALFDNNTEVESVIPSVSIYHGIEGFLRWRNSVSEDIEVRGLVAIGGAGGRDRVGIHGIFRTYGVNILPVVHPEATVCESATFGPGTQVFARVVVAADARIGEAGIVNHGAVVDHECILGDGVHIAPGATLCGCVEVEDFVMIGAGAVILPRLKIGEGSIIGAGAVVTRDVPANSVVVGNPARITRTN